MLSQGQTSRTRCLFFAALVLAFTWGYIAGRCAWLRQQYPALPWYLILRAAPFPSLGFDPRSYSQPPEIIGFSFNAFFSSTSCHHLPLSLTPPGCLSPISSDGSRIRANLATLRNRVRRGLSRKAKATFEVTQCLAEGIHETNNRLESRVRCPLGPHATLSTSPIYEPSQLCNNSVLSLFIFFRPLPALSLKKLGTDASTRHASARTARLRRRAVMPGASIENSVPSFLNGEEREQRANERKNMNKEITYKVIALQRDGSQIGEVDMIGFVSVPWDNYPDFATDKHFMDAFCEALGYFEGCLHKAPYGIALDGPYYDQWDEVFTDTAPIPAFETA